MKIKNIQLLPTIKVLLCVTVALENSLARDSLFSNFFEQLCNSADYLWGCVFSIKTQTECNKKSGNCIGHTSL